MTEALIFDMDGLLFDSERIVQRSWEEAGNELGIPHMGDQIYHTLGMNRAGRYAYFARTIREDFPFEEFGRLASVSFYRIVEREGLPMKPGAGELLEYAKQQGYKMAVATSSSRAYAQKNLEDAGIESYFDGAVYGDMVQHAKPDPEIYLRAAECIGVTPKSCIALEDAPGGIRSAHAAGMLPVMIPDLVEPTEEILSLVYRKFHSLREVIPFLESL